MPAGRTQRGGRSFALSLLLVALVLLLCITSSFGATKKTTKPQKKIKNLPVCVYIRTYKGHLPWLSYLFASLEKFFPDRSETVVAFPEENVSEITEVIERTIKTGVKLVPEKEILPGIYQQQVSKLNADAHCTSDFIMHVDSRTFFYRKVDRLELFSHRKGEDIPFQFFKYYSEFPDEEIQKWQTVTRKLMKLPVEENFMIVNHHVYPRWLYPKVRQFISNTHKMTIEQYITTHMAEEGVCRGCVISEYNLLGAYLYYFEYDSARWLDAANLFSKSDQAIVIKNRVNEKQQMEKLGAKKRTREKMTLLPRLTLTEMKALKSEFLLVARTEEQGVMVDNQDISFAGVRQMYPTQSYIGFMQQVLNGFCVPDTSKHYSVACGSVTIPNTNSPLWPAVHALYLENVHMDMLDAMQREADEERDYFANKEEL